MGPKPVTAVLVGRWDHADQTRSAATGRHGETRRDGCLGNTGLPPTGSRRRRQGALPRASGGAQCQLLTPDHCEGSKCGFGRPVHGHLLQQQQEACPAGPSTACLPSPGHFCGSNTRCTEPPVKVYQEWAPSPPGLVHRQAPAIKPGVPFHPGKQLPSRPFRGHTSPPQHPLDGAHWLKPLEDSPGIWGCSVAAGPGSTDRMWCSWN